MRPLILSASLASPLHGAGSVSLVLWHLLAEFVRRGHEPVLQAILGSEDRRPLSPAELASVEALRKLGVEVLPPFFRSDYLRPRRLDVTGTVAWAARPLQRHVPTVGLAGEVRRRLAAERADAILVFWDPEGLGAAYGIRDVPKVAYYGMPAHLSLRARANRAEVFFPGRSAPYRAAMRYLAFELERAHLWVTRDYDVLANICREHADYYAGRGHPRSVYIPCLWPTSPALPPMDHRALQGQGPVRILASVGHLGATGNTFGLLFLGERLLPLLDQTFGPGGYEVHLAGGGEALPFARQALQHPSIRWRGFVPDLDAEIASAHVFLVPANAGPYRGSHTRFLHAWALGACAVGHAYNHVANPEMVDGENVLLGETPEAIVDAIAKAAADAALRDRLGEAGRATLHRHHAPSVVGDAIIAELDRVVALHQRR